MKLIQKIKIYLTVLATLLVIDAVWLNIFSANLYKENLNELISSHTNLLAGLLFYLIYAFALSYLIIFDGIKNPKTKAVLIRAFVLGLAAYSTFDLTGEAVFKNWPSIVSIIDISWGSILTVATTFVTLRIYNSKK